MKTPAIKATAAILAAGLVIAIAMLRPHATAPAPTRMVTDMDGRKVAIPQRIERVACLEVLCYQQMFMAGQSAKIVTMVTTDAPWMGLVNPAARSTPSYDGQPGFEGLLARRVDVAFVRDADRNLGKLATIGVPALMSQAPGGGPTSAQAYIESQKQSVRLFAQVLGDDALARQWCDWFDDRVRHVTARVAAIPAAQRLRVYYLRGPDALITQGPTGAVYWLSTLAGADMVVKSTGIVNKGPVSMEDVVRWNPQVILVGRQYSPDLALRDPRWQTIAALRDHRVIPSPAGVFYWDGGPESALLMEFMAKTLYPDHFRDLDMVKEVRDYYRRFYRFDLSQEQARLLLAGFGPGGKRSNLFNS